MAKASYIHVVAQMTNELTRAISTCGAVAQALIETGQAWRRAGSEDATSPPTDFERARAKVLRHTGALLARLRAMRRRALSPDAIRACHHVESIQGHCQACPTANLAGTERHEPFTCLATRSVGEGFRFELGEGGQILERH